MPHLLVIALAGLLLAAPAGAKTMFAVVDGGDHITWLGETAADGAPVPAVCPPGCFVIAPDDARVTALRAQQDGLGVYAAKIAAGLAVTSTGTPALTATYAVDTPTQVKIQAVALYIAVNNRFPAGQTALAWPDIAGTPRAFPTTASFQAFATAVGDYVAALELAAATPDPAWPTAAATIP